MNIVRSVASPGASVSLEEKGALGVSVCQKGDTPPKNRVLSITAPGHQSTMGTQWREPVILPAGGRKASKKRRYLT